MPFFFALYRVIYSARLAGEPNILLGKTFFGVPLETHWFQLPDWGARLGSVAGLTIIGLVALMSITTYVSQRQLMSRQTAQVNPQQQTLMKVMPLMFFVFGFNVPLAVIIYWVTTNFWSVGQQYVLLRHQIQPAAASAPAGAAAATQDTAPRRRLGPLSLFRGNAGPSGEGAQAPGGKNGSKPQARDSKAAPKQEKPKVPPNAPKGGQARPTQAGRPGSGSGRKPSSGRPAGKGKASGPRRGKR
jgi:YidC/Oxa1 family membrane protein insertase